MTTISWASVVQGLDRDWHEKSLRPWVYRFGQVSENADPHQKSQRGRLVVQGEAQPGQPYSWLP